MTTLETALDPRAPSFLSNRSEALAALSLLDAAHAQARDGGGEREVTRHHARGKLLPRERIELLVDRDTALLELAATAGHEEAGEVAGAGVVTALGVVEGAECVLVADDPTVTEDGLSEVGWRKIGRAAELARLYGLPLISLVERAERAPGGLVAVFGAYEAMPLAELTVGIGGQGDVTLVDAVADDERNALRLMRLGVRQLARRPGAILKPASPPCHEVEDLLAVSRVDVREVLARVLDGSEFEEFRAHRGPAMVAGFGAVHGCRVAVLGNTGPVLDAEAVHKGLELVRVARVPLLVFVSRCAPSVELSRALSHDRQVTVVLDGDPPDWATVSRGFRFGWLADDVGYDGAIDPRDTRTVLGIALSAMGGRSVREDAP